MIQCIYLKIGEFKYGKITKVEEATEKQKKQKELLRKKSAKIALGVAIAAMTSLLATNPHVIEKENEIATKNTLSDEELDTISTIETIMKEYHQTAEESTQKEIMTEMSDFLSDKINNTTETTENTETVTLSRDELLQGLVDNGLTIDEANKQIIAAEEKAANEQGLHTEAEYNEMISAINQGISIEEQRELANQQLANYNDYEKYYDDSNYTVDENTNSSGKVR